MVYIADVTGYGVMVYDYQRNVAWRTQNKYFYPTPDNGTFTIAGESFDLMDGVLGMSLSRKSLVPRAFGFHRPIAPSIPSNRYLFFHSLASISENRVALGVLDNQTAWSLNPDFSPRSFVVRIASSITLTTKIDVEHDRKFRNLEKESVKVQLKQWIKMEICFSDLWIQ